MRPYLSHSIEDLEKVFIDRQDDPYVLTQLLEELSFRQTKRARKLLARVSESLADYEPDADNEDIGEKPHICLDNQPDPDRARASPNLGEYPEEPDMEQPVPQTAGTREYRLKKTGDPRRQLSANLFGTAAEEFEQSPDDRMKPHSLSRMRPLGTSGLPSPWTRPLDTSLRLESGPEPVDRYIVALTSLIEELRRDGGRKRYELENGQRVEGTDPERVYRFVFSNDAELFEDAKVEIEVQGRRVDGSVVSIQPGTLILLVSEDLGPDVPRAVLIIDETALLEALKGRLTAAKTGEIILNRAMANAVVEPRTPTASPNAIPDAGAKVNLNLSQASARSKALGQAVTYIWGPPGCGKTYTLAEVVRTAFEAGRRILICSNTNKAVDQVLYRICESLTLSHPAMQEGRVVRMGRIADDKLASEYSDYVTVEGIAARLSRELVTRIQQLQDDIARIDTKSAEAKRIIELFARLGMAERREVSLQESVNRAARDGKTLLAQIVEVKGRIGKLEIEQNSRGKLFGLFKRSPEAIERDILAAKARLAKLEGQAVQIKISYGELCVQYDQSVKDKDSAAAQCAHHDRAAAQAAVDKAERERSSLVADLREIEAKIADIEASIVKNAKILGATTTKAYLAVWEIGLLDMVIIDEGSMVLLPMVWFAAGMAKDQVVVCGDFRQIPPIIQTNSQAIFDILGHDVFSAAGLDDLTKADGRMVMLNCQRRMDDSICRLISAPMYKGLLRTELDPQLWAKRKSRKRPPSPFDGTLTIVDTSDLWPFESVNPFFSRFNLMHALLVRNLAWHFAERGYVMGQNDMGVCTPYAAQAKLVRKLLEGESLGHVQVGTVHAFQGDERNLMVIEIPEGHGGRKMLGQFVQGVPPRSVGARLINVAISRAENHVLALVNLTHLDRLLPSTSLLRGILFDMQEHGRVVAGSEVLRLRPIDHDLKGLIGRIKLDMEANEFGLFNQSTFDAAIEADIQSAEESIVIFSGFITPSRVAKLGDLLRFKIQSGVAVRCVTRPPHLNGTMDSELGKDALDALEGIGCVIDCRARIHEKVVVIDKKVVWHGSLNVLSHSHRTDESMTRVVNSTYAQAVAAAMSKRPISAEKALNLLTEAENPRCPNCGARTYYNDGKFGPFFACETDCGWHQTATSNGKAPKGKGTATSKDATKKGPPCPICGNDTKRVSGPYGEFYGCVRFPQCNGKVKVTPTKTKRA